MSTGIPLSPTHGVNPSLMLCFYCGQASGVALLGRLPGDRAAPHQGVFDRVPCTSCKAHMDAGIILISVRDDQEGAANPYRTGGWVVVREAAIRRAVAQSPELLESILKQRVAFIPNAVWRAIGLPTEHLRE